MIIGIHGKKRSGKNTVANYLKEIYPEMNVINFSFAGALKHITLESAPLMVRDVLTYEDLEGEGVIDRDKDNIFELAGVNEVDRRNKLGTWINRFRNMIEAKGFEYNGSSLADYSYIKTVRDILVFFGTEIGRDMYVPTIWEDIVTKSVLVSEKNKQTPVLTDVRFDNEAKMVTKNNGIVLEVIRSDQTEDKEENTHRSEYRLPPELIDYTLFNKYGDIDHLHGEIDSLIENLKGEGYAI